MKKVKIVLCLLLVTILLLYPYYRSYYDLEVTHYTIYNNKISQEIKLIVISDVHDEHCKIKDKITQKIEELKPDMILCVGDILDQNAKDDQGNIDFLKSLDQIAPTYYALGNHEIDFYKQNIDKEVYLEAGIDLLENDYIDLSIREQRIRIGGMYDYAFSLYNGKIDGNSMKYNDTYLFLDEFVDTDQLKIMMAHRPDSFIFGEAKNWDIDLIVSGHYHGGQVILPFIGGIYAPELGYLPMYTSGVYPLGHINMVITRGISSSIEKLPRYNNPPEIVEIDIK